MNEHIIELLDKGSFASLNEAEQNQIREHVSGCASCMQSYEAAQLTSAMLKEHAAQAFAPSPFFQTRVLALLREREATAKDAFGLGRMWRAAGALVSSMAATVAILAVVSFVAPGGETAVNSNFVSGNYSTESVFLDDTDVQDDQSDAQVLTTLYEGDEEVNK